MEHSFSGGSGGGGSWNMIPSVPTHSNPSTPSSQDHMYLHGSTMWSVVLIKTVEGQKQKLEESEQSLHQRKDLITKYRRSVEDLLSSEPQLFVNHLLAIEICTTAEIQEEGSTSFG